MADTSKLPRISLALRLIVGLERERVRKPLAGIRTFPIITLFGSLCALLGERFGGWIVAVGLAVLAVYAVAGIVLEAQSNGTNPGLTTEATMLVMFCVGAYLMVGYTAVAIAVGGVVAVLLHWKPEMHSFAGKIGDRDFKAIMQFVLISLVVLPVLPDRYYGPFDVLNPFRIWLLVVLIVGISLGGYVAYKLFGEKAGALIGAILGGIISSTATTVSYARSAHSNPAAGGIAAFVILAASAASLARVFALIGATSPGLLNQAAGPLGIMFGVLVALAVIIRIADREQQAHMPQLGNPSELKTAVLFGLLFAVVLMAVAAGEVYFGRSGLFIVAALSGMTDMDAITLSVTQMVNLASVQPETGWRLILVAVMANLSFKWAVVAVLGNRKLTLRIGLLFAAAIAVGFLLLTLK